MADSEAVRSRRKRAHASGDHRLCRSNCATVRLAAPVPAGEVTDALAEMRQLAFRMAEAHRADPGNAILGAELRKTLQALAPGKSDDGLGDLYSALSEA